MAGVGMAGQQLDVAAVVAAVEVLHNPREAKATRQQAHDLCESVKADDAASFACAAQLVVASMPYPVRHFGFQLYEHLITKRWSSLSDGSKQQMKEVSLQIISQGTDDTMLSEPHFIKEKAVQLVALIAKREWPHGWPTLFAELTRLSQSGDAHCELAMLVLRGIVEGLFDEGMSDGRRNELLVTLNNEIPALYAFCFQVLQSKFVAFNNAPAGAPEQRRAKLLVTATLQVFEAYAPLSSLPVICECGILEALHALLHRGEFREVAVAVLLAVTSKKSKDAPAAPMCGLVQALLDSCRGGLLQETEYDFHKRLCMSLTELGANHFYAIAQQDAVRDGYLELMASFTSYPSLYVAALTTPFWRTHLDALAADPATPPLPQSVHGMLLNTVVEKLGNKPAADDQECEDEFADKEEYARFWGQAKAKFLEIARKASGAGPLAAVMFVGARWQQALAAVVEAVAAGGALPERGVNSMEADLHMLDCVMTGLPPRTLAAQPAASQEEEVLRSQVVGSCQMLVRMLLDTNFVQQEILAAYVTRALVVMLPYFRQHAGEGSEVLVKLLTLYERFPLRTPQGQQASHAVVTMRRRVSAAVVKLGQAMAAALLPVREQLNAQVQALMGAQAVTGEETSHLYEFLFVLSNPLPSDEERARFLDGILFEPMSTWQAVADPERWMVGALDGGAVAEEAWETQRQLRGRVHGLLVTLLCVFRRCLPGGGGASAAFGGSGAEKTPSSVHRHAQAVLPNLTVLIRSLHTVWTPEFRARVHGEWQVVYKPVEYEATADPEYKISSELVGDSRMMDLCGWLRHMRDAAYQLAGVLTQFSEGFYGAVMQTPALLDAMLSLLPCLEQRHLRTLLRLFITPMVKHCPPQLHPAIVGPLLPSVLSLLLDRIEASYAGMRERDAGAGGGGAGTERQDIISDQILRLLHREVVELGVMLFDGHQALPPPYPPQQGHGMGIGSSGAMEGGDGEGAAATGNVWGRELTEYVSANAAVGVLVVKVLCCTLLWPDSGAFTRAIGGLQRLVPLVKLRGEYHGIVGRDLLRVVLAGLTGGGAEGSPLSISETPLMHLLRDIYVHLVAVTPIVREVLAQALGASDPALDELHEAVLGRPMAEKKQRGVLKEWLRRCTGGGLGQDRPQIPPVLGMVREISRGAGGGGQAGWSEEERELCFAWVEGQSGR